MIVVIQCAGTKWKHAGFMKTGDSQPVNFVAHPDLAPATGHSLYARPDDPCDQELSWREKLLVYNEEYTKSGHNPFGLLPAFELYQNDIYRALTARFGTNRTYILSAGWGLIKSAFLTPYYDITFSAAASRYIRRRKSDLYNDFCMLPDDTEEPIMFFGSKEYVTLFARITYRARSQKTIFYNSTIPPNVSECLLIKFETKRKTNWQYECVSAFLKNEF
jgi:hypothetical protein